jgi:hypothetical protein
MHCVTRSSCVLRAGRLRVPATALTRRFRLNGETMPQPFAVPGRAMCPVGPRPIAAEYHEEHRKLISGYMNGHTLHPGSGRTV